MKHTVDELYHINGKGKYTMDYILKHNVPKASKPHKDGYSMVHFVVNADSAKITTADGVMLGYFYGAHTWFDTREERDAYREEQKALRAASAKRNKMLKAIADYYSTMNSDELEAVMKSLGL